MELKKNPKADLTKKYALFLNIGLTLSLVLVTVAFEWRVYDSGPGNLGKLEDEFEEQLEIPLTQQPPPPPPPIIIPPEIIEVPDEEEIEEEIIDLDMEIDEDMAIEDPIYAEPEEENINEIFEVVEERPEPIGGTAALLKYLRDNIRYPKQALRIGLEGRVYLKFIIERDGTVSNVQVRRGIGGGCDEEAVRVLNTCPIKWTPGKQRGQPVRVYYSLPVAFKLKE